MKKNSTMLLLAGLLASGILASCGGSSSSSSSSSSYVPQPVDQDVATLIASLRGTSHTVNAINEVYVNQDDEDAIDQYLRMESTFVFSYDSNDERAYRITQKQINADLEKGTREIKKDKEGNPILTTYDLGSHLYFRDTDTGVVLAEYLDATNTVSTYIQSEYDYTNGVYTPVIFDEEFRNPFDYIQPRDITKSTEANTFTLNSEKASFALASYGIIGYKTATGATIKTGSDGKVSSVEFAIPDDGGEGYYYDRTTTFKVEYTNIGSASTLHHPTKKANNNPKLKTALASLNNAQSYKYSKTMYESDGTEIDHIMGYFTQKAAFYHHHDSPDDTHCYEVGDDYDYIAAICEANQKYYAFSWSYGEPSWGWGLEMLSSSAAYSIASFAGLGPQLSSVASEVFVLKEGTDNVYVLDDDDILRSAGAYFDIQFLGCNSQVLESNTDHLEITLADDGSITIDTGYSYAEYGYTKTVRIVYQLDVATIDNTTLPSYVTIPDTTGLEEW